MSNRTSVTLARYIRKRNGVPAGAPGSLRNMLYRSLGAYSFSVFWKYWNPIFGYYLGRFVFKPLHRYLPRALSLLLTFVACGMIHDAVTTVVRNGLSFFFTCWFFLMGLCVIATEGWKINYRQLPWIARALVNAAIAGFCFFVTWLLIR